MDDVMVVAGTEEEAFERPILLKYYKILFS